MGAVNIVRELVKGAIAWYSFKEGSRLLLVMNDRDYANRDYVNTLSEYLGELKLDTDIARIDDIVMGKHPQPRYDYILGLLIVESSKQPVDLLKVLHELLLPDGRLLLGTDNRLGVRYFCGDRDPYTWRCFDGIEHYYRMTAKDFEHMEGRCYSKAELQDMLQKAGFSYNKFYAAMPNLQETQLVYAEGYLPNEELAIRYFPTYNYPDSVFLEEQYLYTDLAKNGLFHVMANSYIIESSLDGKSDDTLHATISMDRGRNNSMVTCIKENSGERWVEKKPIYPEAASKIKMLRDSEEYLKSHGVQVLQSINAGNIYKMPYIKNMSALSYWLDLAKRNKEAFIKEMDTFRDIIIYSSEHIKEDAGDGMGVILARGYIDLVPLNCFYIDNEAASPKDRYLFYDQEFYEENYPANVMIYRMLLIVYGAGQAELEAIIPMRFFMERYVLEEQRALWQKKASQFIEELRNQKELRVYNAKRQCNYQTLYSNRQRINYSAEEYQKIFVDILKDADKKKIVLFGSGKFSERFLVQFKRDYNIYAIVDNNSDKWGTLLEGIEIKSPDILKEIAPDERHIIICIKNYVGTVLQIRKMGIEDYHVYNPGVVYPRKQHSIEQSASIADAASGGGKTHNAAATKPEKKPYHTGYVAGVFDLFHIGHLNMFKHAKEQCDYLIVGVVSDEGVRINKGTEPFIPFEERIEMVRSCRYVDEAVEIPFNYGGTKDAYQMYHFDCQFSGSDYINDPNWLAEKEFLEKNGAEMVFFPYTESTSSTKLKKMIDKKLL